MSFEHPVSKRTREFTLLVDALKKSGVYQKPYAQYIRERNANIEAAKKAPSAPPGFVRFDPDLHHPTQIVGYDEEGALVRSTEQPTPTQWLNAKLLAGEARRRNERAEGIFPIGL